MLKVETESGAVYHLAEDKFWREPHLRPNETWVPAEWSTVEVGKPILLDLGNGQARITTPVVRVSVP